MLKKFGPVFLFIFLVTYFFTTSSAQISQTLSDIGRIAKLPETCTGNTAPFICKNCRELKFCSRPEPNKFVELSITTCSSTQTCITGTCTADTSGTCTPYSSVNFTCPHAGVFPDADCTKYHVCYTDQNEDLVDVPQKCDLDGDQKYGFNIKTLSCGIKLTSNKCPANAWPTCKAAREMGSLASNPTYYYICVEDDKNVYPIIQVCPFGRSFAVGSGCT